MNTIDIKATFENKDILTLTLEKDVQYYKLNPGDVLSLMYGEYNVGDYEGSLLDDKTGIDIPTDNCFYMACTTEYFRLADKELALEAFKKRIMSGNPAAPSGLSSSLEEILGNAPESDEPDERMRGRMGYILSQPGRVQV